MSHPSLQHELGKREPFTVAEEEVFLNLVRTVERLSIETGRLLKPRGLSEATYNILRILRGEGGPDRLGIPCGTIGQRTVTQVPDITRLVDRLERSGLVERLRTGEDRRVVLVRITEGGMELLAALDGPATGLHRAQLGHLSRGELEELNRLLVKARSPPRPPSRSAEPSCSAPAEMPKAGTNELTS